MKKIACLLALICLMFAGCSTEKQEPVDLAVVALNGQNMPQLNGDAINDIVNAAVAAETGTTVSMVVADGSPHLAQTVKFDEKEAKSAARFEMEKKERTEAVNVLIQTSTAQTEGTDLLSAIQLAGRQLQAGQNSEKILVIAHMGVNTQAPLEMQNGDLSKLGEDTVEQLKQAGYLAQLNGCCVYWLFMGDAAGSQPKLQPSQVDALQAFWQSYLTASGCTQVEFSQTLPSLGELATAPEVPVIGADSMSVDLGKPVSIDETVVSFLPDSIELAQPDAARTQLEPLADAITNSAQRFLLAGSTATVAGTDPQENKQFGLRRAQAVRDLLLEMGVPESKLICIGIGDADSSIRAESDSANRTVWLVEESTALADELMGIGITEQ